MWLRVNRCVCTMWHRKRRKSTAKCKSLGYVGLSTKESSATRRQTSVVYSCCRPAAAVMSSLPPPVSVALVRAFRYTSSLICKWCGTRAFRWRNTGIPASWLTLWSWCRNRCLFVRVYAFVSGSFIDWIRQCDTTKRSCRLCNDWCIAGTPCHQPDGARIMCDAVSVTCWIVDSGCLNWLLLSPSGAGLLPAAVVWLWTRTCFRTSSWSLYCLSFRVHVFLSFRGRCCGSLLSICYRITNMLNIRASCKIRIGN